VAIHNMLELQLRTPYRLQVCTLGDVNGWRNIRIPYDIRNPGECIHVDGSLFWIHRDECNIVAFDLSNEVFELLPVPPFHNPEETYYKRLHILKNCLCVVLNHCQNLEIWSIKKRKRKLELNNNSSIEESTDCWSWNKELSMPLEGLGKFSYMSSNLIPVTVLKDGQVLLCDYDKKVLFLYDQRTTTTKKIVDNDVHKWDYVRSLPHMNSFASLKALGMNSKWI
ncbi:hypothetical protein MKW92_027000, partial [Papaver armeniacum]